MINASRASINQCQNWWGSGCVPSPCDISAKINHLRPSLLAVADTLHLNNFIVSATINHSGYWWLNLSLRWGWYGDRLRGGGEGAYVNGIWREEAGHRTEFIKIYLHAVPMCIFDRCLTRSVSFDGNALNFKGEFESNLVFCSFAAYWWVKCQNVSNTH